MDGARPCVTPMAPGEPLTQHKGGDPFPHPTLYRGCMKLDPLRALIFHFLSIARMREETKEGSLPVMSMSST